MADIILEATVWGKDSLDRIFARTGFDRQINDNQQQKKNEKKWEKIEKPKKITKWGRLVSKF